MSKAEDRYLEHFQDGRLRNCSSKEAFLLGYNQAEKDSELTWEDIREICRMWIESKTPFGVTGEALSIEVLKRFKSKKNVEQEV